MQAKEFYQHRKEILIKEHKKLKQKKSVFGLLRLGNITAVIAVFYFLWTAGKIYAITIAVILLIIFIRLIYKDLANRAAIENAERLIQINEDEITALSGSYFHFKNGLNFNVHDHLYANDMDIFGHASLYQFLNRTSSESGGKKLAQMLCVPANEKEILERQQAIKESRTLHLFRQQLQATGIKNMIREKTVLRLMRWLTEPTLFLQFKPWQILRYALPAISLAVTLCAIFNIVSMNVFYGTMLIFGIIAFQINKIVSPIHEQLSKIVDEVDVLSESISVIEKQKFSSPLLKNLQKSLQSEGKSASAKIKSLKKILDKLDLRYNIVVSAPLNLLLLWNLQQILDLENWKKQNHENLQTWFDVLAYFESLNSFATIHFNNPDWVFPNLRGEHFYFKATALGHPLIPAAKRVNNFIDIDKAGKIIIVTGSNMAGKSTYLRSIGVNVVLAMAGAAVCANEFEISPVQLLSSMRIADNLEESTSTFYAELKKLKTVIEKINNKENVFVLLDEILRGTNSLDRHTGSVALIKQLIKQNAVAILATHDVELAEMKKEYPQNIINNHFDVQVNGEELFFDYKLKSGVCTSMNASILMKKIGLEID
jgi:predicted DNA-binding protein YlxM (UPF0122 family)